MKEKTEIITKKIKDNAIMAESREFAYAIKEFDLWEWKALIYIFSFIDFTKKIPDRIYLDKRDIAKAIGIKPDDRHLSEELKKKIKLISEHSSILTKDDNGEYIKVDNIINNIEIMKEKNIAVSFNETAFSFFGELNTKPYITILSSDIFNMTDVESILFYEFLRVFSDIKGTSTWEFSTSALKELLRIPWTGNGSFVNKRNGHFERGMFEKRVLDKICIDINKSKMIKLLPQKDENGNILKDKKGNMVYYKKNKDGKKVKGYIFNWMYYSKDELDAIDIIDKE